MGTHLDLLYESIVSIHKGHSKRTKLETYIARLDSALCQEFGEEEMERIQTILRQLKPVAKKPKGTSGYDLFRKAQCATRKSEGGHGNPNTYFSQIAREWKALGPDIQDVWRLKATTAAIAHDSGKVVRTERENHPNVGNVEGTIRDID